MADNLVEQGIELLKNGDKERARGLLQQAVEENPDDAQAWYYLAAAAESPEERRRCLSKVLEIDPDNAKAQEQLAKLSEQATETRTGNSQGQRKQVAAPDGGFKLPVAIPGTPETVTPQYLVDLFTEKFMNGIAILRRQSGVYAEEVQRATWWHFWSYVVIAYIISALASTISSTITQARLANTFRDIGGQFFQYQAPNAFNILTTFILSIPLSIAVLYIGLKASHWWVSEQRNGQGSFVKHAYAIMLPATTVSVISSVVTLLFSIVPLLAALVGLATLILAIYALFVAADGIRMVHKVEGNTVWLTLVVMIVAEIAAGLVLGLILSPFLLSSGFSAFL